jgi:hypothetical protein
VDNLHKSNDGKPVLEVRLTKLEGRVQNMGTDIESRRFHDSLVSARMLDELGAIANKNKEDHLIITGMTTKTVMPQGYEEKKNGLRKWLVIKSIGLSMEQKKNCMD